MSATHAPSPIVIDASAIVELLLHGPAGERVRRAVGERELLAPDVANPEVAQTLRGLERAGKLSPERASRALERFTESGIASVPTRPLLRAAWELRANLSAYDACYVALARALDSPLLSTDGALRRAPRLGITIISVC